MHYFILSFMFATMIYIELNNIAVDLFDAYSSAHSPSPMTDFLLTYPTYFLIIMMAIQLLSFDQPQLEDRGRPLFELYIHPLNY